MIHIKQNRNLIIGHILFWIGYLGLMIGLASNAVPTQNFFLQRILPAICFQASFAYLNIGLFIPYLLKVQRYLLYILASVGCIFLLLTIRIEIVDFFGGITEHPVPPQRMRGLRRSPHLMQVLGPFFSMLTIWGFSTGYSFFRDWIKSQKIAADLRQQQLTAELKFLKNQINPHFLFNSLNNLYTLTYMKDDKAAPMVLKLAEMMRYMLKKSPTERVLISEEIAFLQNFIELHKLKTDAEREITFEVGEMDPNRQIAPLLLLNFFENSFKYGNWEKNPQAWIRASLHALPNQALHFHIENSVKPTQNRNWKQGIGIENTKRRLDLLYSANHQLNIIHQGDRFIVDLVITN